MPLESRTHMVSFRLTREEHERFRQLCFAHGLPSISEMARAAINMMFSEAGRVHREPFESRLAELETRVGSLAAELQKLSQQPPRDSVPSQQFRAT